ncbi:MAG TPA: cell wall-binding repeat-containing protein, partial [Egibacteraceae bacterium]|nr:cell wall-binding repeat-containing protein [Egibacteraceae bacterium]
MIRRRLPPLPGALALVLLFLLLPAGPAAAHPLAHPAGPRVLNVRPAGGDVVARGAVTVAALVVSGQDIAAHTVRVDGVVVESTRGTGSHATVAAVVDLAAGDHIAEVVARDAGGRQATRAWRFTVSDLPVRRLRGTGRVETAVAVSADLFPRQGDAAAAVLARADDYADALAGVPLAQHAGGPLLLSAGDALSAPSAEELRRAVAPGGDVYLLGGPAALSAKVAGDVAALGFRVRRLSGRTRYATAAAIAAELPPAETAVVVSGASFADALAASSPAAANGWPVLLTLPDALPGETRAALDERGVGQVFVVGGTAAVSDAVLEELRARGGAVERLAGPGRYDTADRVARRFFAAAGVAALASGEHFPDALAGSRHAAAHGVPLLLAAPGRLLPPQRAYVEEHAPDRAVVYGGSAAVAERAVADVRRAALDRGGPELVRAEPAEGRVVSTLDQVVLGFDRELVPEHSIVFAEIGGHEVATSLSIGDFPDTLVVSVAELPSN